METQSNGKPRLRYAAVFAIPAKPTYPNRSFAWMIQQYIEETSRPGSRQYCISRSYTLKRLQEAKIGSVLYDNFEVSHWIDHCTGRAADGILPQTVNQDSTYASSVLKHAVEVWGWDDKGLKSYLKAKPLLKRRQLIAKANRRTRRPTPQEFARLLELASAWDVRPKNKIAMTDLIRIQAIWARRISETCRITRKDVDVDKRLCLVRDLKNPMGKGFHASFPLIEGAWELVEKRLREIPNEPDARLFPYNAKSVEAKFIKMTAELGIEDLHLHDLRRESISRLFELGYNVAEVACVSLHFNASQLLGVYTKLDPSSLLGGPAAKRGKQ